MCLALGSKGEEVGEEEKVTRVIRRGPRVDQTHPVLYPRLSLAGQGDQMLGVEHDWTRLQHCSPVGKLAQS
jgi:hypothetical protein